MILEIQSKNLRAEDFQNNFLNISDKKVTTDETGCI
jgi:hypothetical protein